MNTSTVNLSSIMTAIQSRPPQAALPANLEDSILQQVARDLRIIERYCNGDESVDPPLERPMSLVAHLLPSHSEVRKKQLSFQLDEELWPELLMRYLHYIEREIVSRVIKEPCQLDTGDLIGELRLDIAVNSRWIGDISAMLDRAKIFSP